MIWKIRDKSQRTGERRRVYPGSGARCPSGVGGRVAGKGGGLSREQM